MPDITMCEGGGCPKRDTCHRHIAKPDSRQSYFAPPSPWVRNQEQGVEGCKWYWPAADKGDTNE